MTFLPGCLYRGDADPAGTRKLVEYWNEARVLMTNLANGGDGLAIFRRTLKTSVQEHVFPGWTSTHFLSFSESRDIAFQFASGPDQKALTPTDSRSFSAALITLDVSRLHTVEPVGQGLFLGNYLSVRGRSLQELRAEMSIGSCPPGWELERALRREGGDFGMHTSSPLQATMLLVNARVFLLAAGAATKAPDALQAATRYREWLALPVDPLPGGELSAQIYDGCIGAFERFTLAHGTHD